MNYLSQKHRFQTMFRKVIQALSLAIRRHRHLTRKDRVTLVLWTSILPVCCIHQLFSRVRAVDGFILIDYSLSEMWYVYFLSRSIAWVLASVAMIRMCNSSLKPF